MERVEEHSWSINVTVTTIYWTLYISYSVLFDRHRHLPSCPSACITVVAGPLEKLRDLSECQSWQPLCFRGGMFCLHTCTGTFKSPAVCLQRAGGGPCGQAVIHIPDHLGAGTWAPLLPHPVIPEDTCVPHTWKGSNRAASGPWGPTPLVGKAWREAHWGSSLPGLFPGGVCTLPGLEGGELSTHMPWRLSFPQTSPFWHCCFFF